MKVKGNLTCYHCGYISGQLIGDSEGPLSSRLFVPSSGHNKLLQVPAQSYKCARCGGPVFLDEVEVVREKAFKCVVDPYETRPGRRPGKKTRVRPAAKRMLRPVAEQMQHVCA